jgi:hypothetical protein
MALYIPQMTVPAAGTKNQKPYTSGLRARRTPPNVRAIIGITLISAPCIVVFLPRKVAPAVADIRSMELSSIFDTVLRYS